MAQIVLSKQAQVQIRVEIAKAAMTRPVVQITWSKGWKDNYRGANGEVHWHTIQEPGWSAVVSDWAEHPGISVERHTVEMDGLRVLADAQAQAAAGSLLVEVRDGQLCIVHND